MKFSFQKYLIQIGWHSHNYKYTDEVLFANIPYFKRCYDQELSAYKAMDWLGDDIRKRNHPILVSLEVNKWCRDMKKTYRSWIFKQEQKDLA